MDVIGDDVAETNVLGWIKELEDVDCIVNEEELELGATSASQEELKAPGGRPKVRIDKLLRDVSTNTAQFDGSNNHDKRLS